MAHPRMYDPDDPTLVWLRDICLTLPESAEVESWGRPTFRAGRKIFACYGVTEDHPKALVFKPDPEEAAALRADDRFFSPPYWGAGGWLGLNLDAPDIDRTEIAELCESSYRQVALKRMIAALDS